jgi:hypothetical protein
MFDEPTPETLTRLIQELSTWAKRELAKGLHIQIVYDTRKPNGRFVCCGLDLPGRCNSGRHYPRGGTRQREAPGCP